MKTTIKRFTASLVMAVAVAAGTARAGVLFSDNFDDGFTSVANQYITGLSINYGQTPTGWVPAGDGAIHVVDRSGAGNWGLMFYEGGNVDTITTATTISGANASGNTYRVTFNLAPACYNGLGQDTTSADGIALQVLDSNGGVLGANTFLPGAFINQAAPGLLPFHAVTLDYTGTGVGAGSVNLNFAGYPAGGGRFGGAIDDVVVQTTVQWPGATGGNWSDGTKWAGGVAPVADDVVEVQGAGGGNMTNDIGSLAAGGIEFQSGAGAFTLSGNAIALDGNLNNLSANPQTVGLNLAINGLDNNSEFNAATNLVVSGIVSEVSAGSSLTKTGAGTLTLGGANTYSGNTTISGGSLAVTGSGQIYTAAGTAQIFVNSGATLQVDRWDGGQAAPYYPSPDPVAWGSGSFGVLTFFANQININGGTIRYTGTNNVHVTDLDGRGFTIESLGATLEAATAGQTWYINQDNRGNFGIASSAGGLLTLAGAGNGEIDKIIPGTGGVSKTGTGTWILAGGNTYTGGTKVNGGRLELQTAGAGGVGNAYVNASATLQLDASGALNPNAILVLTDVTSAVNLNFTGTQDIHALSFDGGLTYQTPGTWGGSGSGATYQDSRFTGSGILNVTSVGGDLTWVGGQNNNTWDLTNTVNWVDTNSNPKVFYNGQPVHFTDSGNDASPILVTGTLSPGLVSVESSIPYTFAGSGKLSGSMSLQKTGSGLLVLADGLNDYTGATTISAGTLQLGANNVIPSGVTAGNFGLGGTLDLNGFSQMVNNLSGGGVVDNSSTNGGSLIINDTGYIVFNGSITSSGGGPITIVKTGPGTLQPAGGPDSYSGQTIVNDGRILLLDGTFFGTGSVTISNNAYVMLWGTLNGGVLTNDFYLYSVAGNQAGETKDSIVEDSGSGAMTLTGTLHLMQTADVGAYNGESLTISGLVTGPGALWKGNPNYQRTGLVTLSNPGNNFSGGLRVYGGTLEVQANGAGGTGDVYVETNSTLQLDASGALNSGAQLVLQDASSLVNLNFTGTQTVKALSLDGGATFQASGTWGAPGSGATYTDSRFSGSGLLNVTGAITPPSILPVAYDSTGTNLMVSVSTITGYQYELLSAASLTPPVVWTPVSTNSGTGGVLTNLVPVNKSQPQIFYRYQVH